MKFSFAAEYQLIKIDILFSKNSLKKYDLIAIFINDLLNRNTILNL